MKYMQIGPQMLQSQWRGWQGGYYILYTMTRRDLSPQVCQGAEETINSLLTDYMRDVVKRYLSTVCTTIDRRNSRERATGIVGTVLPPQHIHLRPPLCHLASVGPTNHYSIIIKVQYYKLSSLCNTFCIQSAFRSSSMRPCISQNTPDSLFKTNN